MSEDNGNTAASALVPGLLTLYHGGKTYQLPPLNLAGLRWARENKVWAQLDKYMENANEILENDDALTLVASVVQKALERNYPEITVEQVTEMVDLGNLMPAVMACRGVDPTILTKRIASRMEAAAERLMAAERPPTPTA